jgi:hypothetical protein
MCVLGSSVFLAAVEAAAAAVGVATAACRLYTAGRLLVGTGIT